MTRPKPARTGIAQAGHARAMEVRLDLARAIREARRDAGLSARGLAIASGVSTDTVIDLEHGQRDHGVEVAARVTAALGCRLRVWLDPGTGVAIHDRTQSAMLSACVRLLHPAWTAAPEVPVVEPVHGSIDMVLERVRPFDLVAVEAESTLHRIEQQVRWATAKADALSRARSIDGDRIPVSRMLLIRSTPATRAAVATYADIIREAYPGRIVDALDALAGTARWPGPTLLWCQATRAGATILDRPPRAIDLGR